MANTYRDKINATGQFNVLQKGTLIGALDLVAGAVVPQTNPTELTDNSSGTASNTLAAITSTTPADLAAVGTQLGIIKNAVASLAAKITAVQEALVDAGIFE